MLTLITAIIGLSSTLAAWFLNPRRTIYAKLDAIYKELESLYDQRDRALTKKDIDVLTLVTARIIRLREDKGRLLSRLGGTS